MASDTPSEPAAPIPAPAAAPAPGAARPRRPERHECQVCKGSFPRTQVLPGSLVRDKVAQLIASKDPDWAPGGLICRTCLNRFRAELVRNEMEKDRGALSALEQEVMRSLREGESIADNLNKEFDASLTLGERIADKVAEFGGSWRFIFIFFAVMALWIVTNSILLLKNPFDPYPYILLNLVLSLLAAIQAPVIMMSQNRQEARDRLRAENDFKVNLKAELEVRAIGDKLDQLIHHQWAHLLEIQQIQMEMIDDLVGQKKKG
ncbi:MAG TPA: DUF1003 domain-containing protein [Alphaproteobacteria bacterium]|nr:DUF1003 domain-containing protein [Alphaproteobacteria bacterium]